jgi:hypothetical protein
MKLGTHVTITALGGLIAAVAVVAALAAGGASAASTACPSQTTGQPFRAWNDLNTYFFAPNAGFESGTTSWSVGGTTTVVSGNESSYLHSASDTKSMKLSAGGWVRTGAMCIDPSNQSIRLMVKGTSGQLKVDALVISGGNIRTWSTQVDAKSGTSWRPSQIIQFAQGSNQFLGATTLQLTFTAIGATWQIDDLYVDPFKSV